METSQPSTNNSIEIYSSEILQNSDPFSNPSVVSMVICFFASGICILLAEACNLRRVANTLLICLPSDTGSALIALGLTDLDPQDSSLLCWLYSN